MKQTQGVYVVGDEFWDRVDDIALFQEKIDEGSHLLVVAQRRMGKTSLLREAERLMADRYLPIYVDLEQAENAPDAIADLSAATLPHASLGEKTATIFENVLKGFKTHIEKINLSEVGISLRAGLNDGNWAAKGDRLFAALAESEKPVILMLDEVPIMVNRMLKGHDYTITPERKADVDTFMSWLRKNSLEHRGKIRIVLTGSIGFEPVLHQAGMSAHLNSFTPFELRPWTKESAEQCLLALGENYGIRFPDGAHEAMIERIVCCIPDHVQMFFGHVRDWCKRNNCQDFMRSDVEGVYNNEMLGVRGHAELTHYEERLKTVLGVEIFPMTIEMLTEAAMNPGLGPEALSFLQNEYDFDGIDTVNVQKRILYVLEHDGYLDLKSNQYFFVSALLRDWWIKRHGMFYTSVRERGQGA